MRTESVTGGSVNSRSLLKVPQFELTIQPMSLPKPGFTLSFSGRNTGISEFKGDDADIIIYARFE
jgi:hypothetical protein